MNYFSTNKLFMVFLVPAFILCGSLLRRIPFVGKPLCIFSLYYKLSLKT